MKLRFVDSVEILGEIFNAAYFPKTQIIEIDCHLPWISKLNCFLHEIPHMVNHLLLGGSNYLDFMWDVFDLFTALRFKDIAISYEYYFGRE